MDNKKSKLCIISKEKDYITEKFLKKVLVELEIPFDKIYWTGLRKAKSDIQKTLLNKEIEEIKPLVILSMGKEPTGILLSLPKNFKLIDYVEHVFTEQCYIIPIWDANYISNRSKSELNQFKRCFKIIRQILFGEKNESMDSQNSN